MYICHTYAVDQYQNLSRSRQVRLFIHVISVISIPLDAICQKQWNFLHTFKVDVDIERGRNQPKNMPTMQNKRRHISLQKQENW